MLTRTGPATPTPAPSTNGRGDDVEPDDAATVGASVAQPELFEAIFRRHHRRIWAYLARMGGPDSADEVTGDVFVAAFSQRDRYDPDRGSVVTWLLGIATNHARTRFRRQGRADRALARFAGQSAPAPSPFDDADAALDDARALDRVRAALTALPERDREMILLVAWENLTYQEVADVLDMELGTVRSRLSRARHRLRQRAGLDHAAPRSPTENADG
jgi:RNA polymerase sigma-70 factor (ECF subfamily)